MTQVLHIKHMVCPRCIATIERILNEMEIPFQSISLGEVELDSSLDAENKRRIQAHLEKHGFELLEEKNAQLIEKMKSIIIENIHFNDNGKEVNLSSLLTDKLPYEYAYLSRLFSSVEGVTLERYRLKQKIEKAKELLCYDELTLSEIAYKLHYSSVAHLSAQFKKETGMTPTTFKKEQNSHRQSLDAI